MASSINADNGVVSGSSGLKSTADTSGVLALQSNGSTGLTLDTSLNVGVGTTSPSLKFQVTGQVGFGTGTAAGVNGSGLAIYASDYPRLTLRNSTTGDTNADGLQIYMVGTDVSYSLQETGYQRWITSSAEAMRLDSSGNLGLGVTPTSVQSGYKAIQIGATVGGGIVSAGTDTYFTNNAYVTGGSWYFGSTGYAMYYNQSSGVHSWTTSSASGTAGGVATMTEYFRIGPAGQIGLSGANYGTAGQVLTSQGSGSAPTWAAAGGGSQAFVAFGSTGESVFASQGF